MQEKYTFIYQGTKEMFLNSLKQLRRFNGTQCYFDNYIIDLRNDEIRFGVERCGHSGGNWFIPEITEFDDHIEFSGTIEYIGPRYSEDESRSEKILDYVKIFFGAVLLSPVLLIAGIYVFIKWLIRKLRKLPPKTTTEDKLYYLMEKHLKCVRI